MSYAHLSQEERYRTQWLRNGGWSLDAIRPELRRAPSTIGREPHRNASKGDGYDQRHAQRQATQRRHTASALPRIDAATWTTVEARLREDCSPEQIVGTDGVAISLERIYQHIAADRQRGGTPRERQRFGGLCIHERSAIVQRRAWVGDFASILIHRLTKYLATTAIRNRVLGGARPRFGAFFARPCYVVNRLAKSRRIDLLFDSVNWNGAKSGCRHDKSRF